MSAAARFVSGAQLGTRLVVRKRVEGGFVDAVGYLRSVDKTECVVETRHGVVAIFLADVVAAKEVPPPPVPRPPRRSAAE